MITQNEKQTAYIEINPELNQSAASTEVYIA
jgi:hypothetical protein